MKKIKNILVLTFLFVFNVINAQQLSSYAGLDEHVEKGKIRIKLNSESYMETGSLKSLSSTDSFNELGLASVDDLSDDLGIIKMTRVFPFSLKHEAKHREHGLHLWVELEFDEGISPDYVVEQYASLADISIAKPVFKKVRLDGDEEPVVYSAGKLQALASSNTASTTNSSANLKSISDESVSFNDPMLASQWHYFNDGTKGREGVDIDLTNAWAITSGNNEIVVAIVDGGIDYDHEDLADNMFINQTEMDGEEGVDDDNNGYIDDIYGNNFTVAGPITDHDHGTHVAGTVAAINNNGIGVAGVAGGDGSGNGVKLLSCQVFDDRTDLSGNFAAAIVYGADMGAVISQNSWGYSSPSYYEPEVLEACQYFIEEAGQYEGSPLDGGILFFAAGNDGLEQTHYPAAFDEVVAVTAFGPEGYPAAYTNSGDWTDICAPGGDQTYYDEDGGVLSTLPGDEYGYYQGTSMATPHASGVAALVLSKYLDEEETLTPEELEDIMLNSTTRFVFEDNDLYGLGMLNAANALADDGNIAPDAITDLEAEEISHEMVRLQWTIPSDEDNFQPATILLAISTEEITDSNFNGQSLLEFTNTFDAGTSVNVDINGLYKETDYWFAIKTADLFSNVSEISNILKVTTTDSPKFRMNKTSISADIDVTSSHLYKTDVEFSNVGEGLVRWSHYIENEKQYQIIQEEEEEEIAEELAALQQDVIDNPELYVYETPTAAYSTVGINSVILEPLTDSHWTSDQTEYSAGLTYEEEDPYVDQLWGTGNPNVGSVVGTRFTIDLEYTFNLTHVEVATYTQQNEEPIIIDIRKGTDIEDAETVYLQEYYNDIIDTLSIQKIPLYHPQRFEDGESFWVVIHFPKEDISPIGCYVIDYVPNTFKFSYDNGRSFEEMQYIIPTRITPLVRAMSAGDDGSYVFMDPDSGEIAANESQVNEVTIDATGLSNGPHLASLTVITNDDSKTYNTIEVNVNVSGHVGSLKTDDIQGFDIYSTFDNSLELLAENNSYSDIEIYSLSSDIPGISADLSDTLTVYARYNSTIPFVINTTQTGVLEGYIDLDTNEGTISLPVRFNVSEPATASVSLSTSTVDMIYGQSKTTELYIENTGSSILEYDLSHYGLEYSAKGQLTNQLSYTMTTSDDANGPEANQWLDITDVGTVINRFDSYAVDSIEYGFDFPFYNEFFSSIDYSGSGCLFFYEHPYSIYTLSPDTFPDYPVIGAIIPFMTDSLPLSDFDIYHYTNGERSIVTTRLEIPSLYDENIEEDFIIEYQIIMFRDGTIEFRYKSVDDIPANVDYLAGISGFTASDFDLYHNIGDETNFIHNGLVIRYEPNEDVSMITEAYPKVGTIASGDTHTIELTIDPSVLGVTAGTYLNQALVYGNITGGSTQLPLTINVEGNASFNSPDTLDFSIVNTGDTQSEYLLLTNEGSDKATITEITFADAEFAREESDEVVIEAMSTTLLPITFSPTNPQRYSSELIIKYSNGDSEIITLLGEGQKDPNFTHDFPESLTVNLTNDEVIAFDYLINSLAGTADLKINAINGNFATIGDSSVVNGGVSNSVIVDDAFGYKMFTSDTITRATYKWEELVGVADNYIIEYNEQLELELPFELPLYGETYSAIWVSRNGYISVNEPTSDYYSYSFLPDDGIAGMIAPFWSNIIPSNEEQGVLILEEEDRVIIQWNKFQAEDANSNPGIMTFQCELSSDGTIMFHYKDVETWGGLMQWGLESGDEEESFWDTDALPIMRDAPFRDSTSIVIAAPYKQKFSAGSENTVTVEVGGVKLFRDGVYNDTIKVYTNSKQKPYVELPLVINYTGSPILSLDDNIVFDDIIYKEGASTTQEFTLYNIGYEELELTHIADDVVGDLQIIDLSNDTEFIRSNSGELIASITIQPWASYTFGVYVEPDGNQNISGNLTLSGNGFNETVALTGNVSSTPEFVWTAQSQDYNMANEDTVSYTFTISNNGTTTMDFSTLAAVVPSGDSEEIPVVDDFVGNYTFEAPIVVDSLCIDSKQVGDGLFTPMVVGSYLSFANRYVAPEGGFYLTHVKTFNFLRSEDEYMNIQIWTGGSAPEEGTLSYEQNFVVDEIVDEEWVYCELNYPINIAAGDTFYVSVFPPLDSKFIGFDVVEDEDALSNSLGGVYNGDGFTWYSSLQMNSGKVWKIRALTASGSGQWVTLSPQAGELAGGESTEIEAKVYGELAGVGQHKANLIVKTNDIVDFYNEVGLDISVNGAPEFIHYPNLNEDTVKVTELDDLVLNFLFSDPENEEMTIELTALDDAPDAQFVRLGDETAQMTITTDYESSGVYEWEVKLQDQSGNTVYNSVLVEVLDKNRTPVFNEDYGVLYMNLADPNAGISLTSSDLFTDPDGDEFYLLSGNYTTDILDLATGTDFISINPIATGTGLIAVAADDGDADGYIVYGIYVIVTDDESAVDASPDGIGSNIPLIDSERMFSMAPNPIKNGSTTAIFNLEEEADVKIEIIDIAGQVRSVQEIGTYDKGLNNKQIDVSGLSTGTYICRIVIGNTTKGITKIVIL